MKKTRYTEEQIAFALKQAETGTRVGEVCRKMGISEATFYNWKKKFAGLGVTELRRLLHELDQYSENQTHSRPLLLRQNWVSYPHSHYDHQKTLFSGLHRFFSSN
ncbi:transposase subfamily protein [Salmonella enterica subsp. arizonae]|uniref:Transposase subfamily protein n=1 Tax=Salmonella enterica subsp. arizonae TaxID=59203 RepID=A0A379SQ95_SALER|nr:transposase subfamily protein [Salmonella enterica subsp. arizonae]SUG51202.1 transposase subfamily protein [Salmonella enterica subsp. arizonae]